MKVHFTASVTGKKLYRENYTKIVKQLNEMGYQVSDMISDKERKDMEHLTSSELDTNYKKVWSQIDKADVIVAEISYSSLSVGFEVTTALKLSKQVLLLHVPSTHISLLEAMKDKNLMICEYTPSDLEKKLSDCLKEIESKMDVRFNFFLSKNLAAQLDTVALNQRINKSEYIRQLIEKDMKKNKRYLL